MGTVNSILRWSAALALGTTSAVYAQSTPPQSTQSTQSGELEEVVVVGLRASLEAAAEIKKDSDLVVDSIVADDIGKFPDNTTAAALQRVPGVQVTVNDNNEIANPIIRGIPDILTTLDGREIFTGVGRGFAFQDLPAEALAGADVFKSSNASLIEGGVAGVINLRLHKPFDFEQGWSGAVNTRGIYGDNVDKFSGTVGGLVSNRWEAGDGEMGALLNVSYSDINFDRPISFNCDPRSGSGSNDPAGGAGAILPTCVGGLNQYGDYQRPQVNAAFQWRPSDELEIYADGIYTEYESRWETDFIFSDIFAAQNITNVTTTDRCDTYRVNPAGFQGSATDPTQNLCVGQSARFNNVPGLTSTQAKDSGTDQYLFATGVRWSSGSWHLDGDISFERSHTENRIIIVDIGKQVSAVDVTINDDKHGTTNMVGNPLGVADDFRFANSLFQDLNDAVGKQFAVAGNGAYDLDGWLSQIQFGVRYADRDSTYRAVSGGPGAPGGNRNTLVSSVNLPSNFLVRSPSSISYINGGQHWLTPNRDFLLDQTDTLRALYGAPAGDPDWNPTRNYDANEQAYAGYLQGKYQFEFGNGWQLDGLLGGRMVRTDREIMGTGTVTPAPTAENPNPAAVLTPVTTDTSDDDFLPSFSARLKLSPDLQLRFSAARTMARPAFEDLNPGLTYEVPINANIRPNGFGGNPNLKSQMSDAYDLTVEYYFARSSYVSAALYYRDIKDRIVDAINPETIDGITYNITRPRNVGSAELQGIELAGQTFFDFLPGFWSGFGAMANFTLADSEITTKDDVLEGEELLGVSKYSYNLGLLYEQSGVTGRLIYTHRSDYTEALLGGMLAPIGARAQFNGVRSNGRLDFSLGYDFTDYLTVSIDGTNLTQAKYYSYFGNTSFPHDVRDDERTFGVSLRARF